MKRQRLGLTGRIVVGADRGGELWRFAICLWCESPSWTRVAVKLPLFITAFAALDAVPIVVIRSPW